MKTRDESALTCSVQRFFEKWLDVDLVDLAAPVDMTGWHSLAQFSLPLIFLVRRRCRRCCWDYCNGVVFTKSREQSYFPFPRCSRVWVWCVYCWFLQKCFGWDTMTQPTNRKPYDDDDDHNNDMRTLCNCQLDSLLTVPHETSSTLTFANEKWMNKENKNQICFWLCCCIRQYKRISANFSLLFSFVCVGPIYVLFTPTEKCCVLVFRPMKLGYKIDE